MVQFLVPQLKLLLWDTLIGHLQLLSSIFHWILVLYAQLYEKKKKINDDFSAILSFQMERIFVQTDHFCFTHEGLGQSLNDT